MASGLVRREDWNRAIASSCPRLDIGLEIGFEKTVKLLDVPQASQPFLDLFLRGTALVRQDFLGFLFQHVNHEFVYGFVSGGVGTLLHLLQQFAFDFYFV
jgi:hypothetical protein